MDIGIAITLFVIFAGIVGNLYYQIAFYNLRVRYDGLVAYNVVRLAEYIDENPIDDITNKTNSELKDLLKYPYPDNLEMEMKVNDKDTLTDDKTQNGNAIIKIVNISAKYQIMGKEFEFSVDKLKMAENIYN